ncbi:chemotaxis protein CheW [Candidatus Ferrigenium straubiae]|jgi:twitching motility protein PilI|uniref:chemotaxis protein CheW n=1 Tax=Candidatus Ferrigenium straubiae TaxID=2919506 RepID=UPI003F4AB2D6
MSRRINLREFQQDLIDRMQAKGRTGDQISTLGVQIAGQNWVVDMHDLGGIAPLPPLTAAPLAKPWFLGMINLRGVLYGVTDLAAYRQQGKASGEAANRVLLVAERHEFNAALLVERVLGLRNARAWERSEAGGQVRYRDEQGNTWNKLDIVGLLGQPEFLQIGA